MECHSGVKRRLLLMHEMTWMDPKGIVTSPQRALYDSIYTICVNWYSDRDGEISDFWKHERVKEGCDCRGVRAEGLRGGGHTNLHVMKGHTHTVWCQFPACDIFP